MYKRDNHQLTELTTRG